jgi:malonyl-CoA O-methyltransferase
VSQHAVRHRPVTCEDEENPVTTLDEVALRILGPPLAGASLLDAGCGRARRLVFNGDRPRLFMGVDLAIEMLAEGRRLVAAPRPLAAGDLRMLPVSQARFDVVWCRLVAGYVFDLPLLYRELARSLKRGGAAVVTDFHPHASKAGHDRTFRGADGRTTRLKHVIHEAAAHDAAAAAAGLLFDAALELAVGPDVRPFYEKAGMLARYEADRGLPVLLALRFRRCA